MIKRWSVEEIANQLRSCGYAMNDPNMDGFTTQESVCLIFKQYLITTLSSIIGAPGSSPE